VSEPGQTSSTVPPDSTDSTESRPIEIGSIDLTMEPPAEEAERSRPRVRRIVLSAVAAVALAGVGVLGYVGWQISSEKDATLTAPATIGGLRLDQSEDGTTTAEYLRTALAAEVDLDDTLGAVYLDGGNKNVLFLGGTGLIWTPESDLDSAFGLISDNEGAVTGLHSVSAGDLGGTMKCGTTKSDDGDLSVCGWADHGSLALAMFTNRPEADSATLLRQIRTATQKRS
jgi:hypothetical protein